MKFFLPFPLALILAACAVTPQDKEAAHQQQLEKEARENFYALKKQLNPNAPPPPTATPAPTPGLFAFLDTRVANSPRPPKPSKTTPRPKDDTVYYWQVQSRSEGGSGHYSAAELRYARELAKSPENLTPEERTWAREHY